MRVQVRQFISCKSFFTPIHYCPFNKKQRQDQDSRGTNFQRSQEPTHSRPERERERERETGDEGNENTICIERIVKSTWRGGGGCLRFHYRLYSLYALSVCRCHRVNPFHHDVISPVRWKLMLTSFHFISENARPLRDS